MSESAAWPDDGDFFRARLGNQKWVKVHIALPAGPNDPKGVVRSACGRFYNRDYAVPADGDEPRQCDTCWERF